MSLGLYPLGQTGALLALGKPEIPMIWAIAEAALIQGSVGELNSFSQWVEHPGEGEVRFYLDLKDKGDTV